MTPHTDETDDSRTVITSVYSQSREVYHTTACRMVWEIGEKKYLSESYAERMGLTHCGYCSGEFDQGSSSHELYNRLLELGEQRASDDTDADAVGVRE